MSAAPYNSSSDYQPESRDGLPALYHWPSLYKISHEFHQRNVKLFGSWHDASKDSLMLQKGLGRDRRRRNKIVTG